MSDEAALLKAIIANPDEDTPRLAYADWLDEHGGPMPGVLDAGPNSAADRAEFIRVQCRLADLSPADPDWVDLTERQDELVARLKQLHLINVGANADKFYFGLDLLDRYEEPFRRGFPYFIQCQTYVVNWTDEEVKRVTAELTKLSRTTTLRAVYVYGAPTDRLAELLAAPVFGELTGLSAYPSGTNAELVTFYRRFGTNPHVRRLKHLHLYGSIPPVAVAELARAKTFDSVVRLTLQAVSGPQSAMEKLAKAPWFRRLRHFHGYVTGKNASVLIAGLGRLPALHTLNLPMIGGTTALAAGKFPALARLIYNGPLGVRYAKALAQGRFPALVAFEADRAGPKNDGLAELLKGKWFEQLRVLALTECGIGDKGVAALARHPVAKTLRILRLGDNLFGRSGLAALSGAGAFPALTTLDIGSAHTRKGTSADLAAFLSAIQNPNLRHLNLDGWPLGNAGAKALADNPTLAGLTRLSLDGCQIGDPGAAALFASPHLRNLVELHLDSNSIKTADAFTDPAVLPRLGELWISGNRIPQKHLVKLVRTGLYLIL
jgi:uncharacterized protein (TIGR02996 family)